MSSTEKQLAVYEFNNHPVELFGNLDNLLWKGKTYLQIIGLTEEAEKADEYHLMDTRGAAHTFNRYNLTEQQKKITEDFLEWLQHDAALRLKKAGAYCKQDDAYHEELSGIKTDYGFIFFTGTFRHPCWSWSSMMRVLELDVDHCPKLFDIGEDIGHNTLLCLHYIFAENPQWADDEDVFERIAHIQKRCATFIRDNVLRGVLPLLPPDDKL